MDKSGSGHVGAGPGFADFAALVKPGIVVSNTFTAVAGCVLAGAGGGGRNLGTSLVLTALGTALLVGGSSALNNWVDRDLDAAMERTRRRPTVTGRIGKGLSLSIGIGLIAGGSLVLLIAGPVPAVLGLAGAFAYLVPYTLWSKRRSALSSFIGGVSGAIPPLIGWSAVDPGLGGPALLLFAFLVAWQQAHVRALALKRESDFRGASLPLAGIDLPEPGNPGKEGPVIEVGVGRTLSPRSRTALLLWIALLLPFPWLVARAAGFEGGLGAAFVLLESLACLVWFVIAALSSRSTSQARTAFSAVSPYPSAAWGRSMFVLSLAYLGLFFAGLMAVAALPPM
jgi:protoheme IX farnesyltransferase